MPFRLIAVDLDNTFVDYTAAFKDCLSQMGYDRYADAPEPSDYGFACDGWFGENGGNAFQAFHRGAVKMGLYLRERPYRGALETLYGMQLDPRNHITFVTSRTDDGSDTCRWLDSYGLLKWEGQDLDARTKDMTTPPAKAWAIHAHAMSEDWSHAGWVEANLPHYCHMRQKELLGADLYVEDEPDTIDRLLDLDLPVLIGRHGYNLRQCERAGQHKDIAAVFDDWCDVPELAARLLER